MTTWKPLATAALVLATGLTARPLAEPRAAQDDGFTGIELKGCEIDIRPTQISAKIEKDLFVNWGVGWNQADSRETALFKFQPEDSALAHVSGTRWANDSVQIPTASESTLVVDYDRANDVLVATYFYVDAGGMNQTKALVLEKRGGFLPDAPAISEPQVVMVGNVPGDFDKRRAHVVFETFGMTTSFTLSD